MADDKLFTVEEVATRLSVHEETVRRWIRNGQIEVIELGNKAGYRISQAALDKFIRDRVRPARDE